MLHAEDSRPAHQQRNEGMMDKSKMKPCPDCGSNEELYIDSCGSMELTVVDCDCGHRFQSGCVEDNIVKHWNRHVRDITKALAAGGEG